MHRRRDGRILKTKIVATMGKLRDVRTPTGEMLKPAESGDFWNTLLQYFRTEDGMYLIDVIRLNMAYFNPPGDGQPGDGQRPIIEWLKAHERELKNVALLGDLGGPKLRLQGLSSSSTSLTEGDTLTLLLQRRNATPVASEYCVCVGEQLVGQLDPQIADTLRKRGTQLSISVGDGAVDLEVTDIQDSALKCRVVRGGVLKDGAGVTLEGVPFHLLRLPSPTQEDKTALDFLIDQSYFWDKSTGCTTTLNSVLAFVGVSFVKTARDVLEVKEHAYQKILEILRKGGSNVTGEELEKEAMLLCPAVIAKIETPDAWRNIGEILDVADGAMVARGDLAQQMGVEEVPNIQKQLIRMCNLRGKPVITATEMLASMEASDRPTRAEANDVFNAILDGSDAVMLSGETASGQYPYQAVKMMVRIAEAAERYYENFGKRRELGPSDRRRLNEQRFERLLVGAEELYGEIEERLREGGFEAFIANWKWLGDLYRGKLIRSSKQEITDRISLAACILSNSSRPKDYETKGRKEGLTILALSTSGRTARMISRFRPEAKIVGVAHDDINRRKLVISYGVWPINCGKVHCECGGVFTCPDDAFKAACAIAKREGCVSVGEKIVFTAGAPLFVPGTTNLLQLVEVKSDAS